MIEDIRAKEDDEVRFQARARTADMARTLGVRMVEVPGNGNCFLHAARFGLLQIHCWNYDLVPTHQEIRAKAFLFLRWNREMENVNGVSLSVLRDFYIDLRQVPTDGTDLVPSRLSYYDTWDQWVTEM